MYLPQRGVQRIAMLVGGTLHQRAVDIEEQQQRSRVSAHRAKEVSGSRRPANAAIRRAAASMSSSETISTGECM